MTSSAERALPELKTSGNQMTTTRYIVLMAAPERSANPLTENMGFEAVEGLSYAFFNQDAFYRKFFGDAATVCKEVITPGIIYYYQRSPSHPLPDEQTVTASASAPAEGESTDLLPKKGVNCLAWLLRKLLLHKDGVPPERYMGKVVVAGDWTCEKQWCMTPKDFETCRRALQGFMPVLSGRTVTAVEPKPPSSAKTLWMAQQAKDGRVMTDVDTESEWNKVPSNERRRYEQQSKLCADNYAAQLKQYALMNPTPPAPALDARDFFVANNGKRNDWNTLSSELRQPYDALAKLDRERYNADVTQLKEHCKRYGLTYASVNTKKPPKNKAERAVSLLQKYRSTGDFDLPVIPRNTKSSAKSSRKRTASLTGAAAKTALPQGDTAAAGHLPHASKRRKIK